MSDEVPQVDAIVIGASAGGIEALFALLEGLPAGFRLPVVVVVHVREGRESRLSEIFRPRMKIPVREAEARAPVEPGTLYFAPSGYHLLVEPDRTFSLSCEPPVLFSRPSIDVLMESCCDAFAPRLAGVVLTGASEDGARGLKRIGERGGVTLVQSPQEAAHPTMPAAAVRLAKPRFVLPLSGLSALIAQMGAPA